jgi:hypothetical protein
VISEALRAIALDIIERALSCKSFILEEGLCGSLSLAARTVCIARQASSFFPGSSVLSLNKIDSLRVDNKLLCVALIILE